MYSIVFVLPIVECPSNSHCHTDGPGKQLYYELFFHEKYYIAKYFNDISPPLCVCTI